MRESAVQPDYLIGAEGLSKTFCRNLRQSLTYGIIDIAREFIGLPSAAIGNRKGEFLAIENLDFSVARGECMGVIGPNGAGKTTLLRLINGLIKPDRGILRVRGRVGGLIALGAGFNPVLTGRENIYINAAVLGLGKRKTDRVLEEIIEFSEIREFIDSPVQSYSSGMLVRLGFSVAVHLDPDVLLIDEVLAVGDAGFRGKCYNRVDELRVDKAVLLVSHNMEHIGRVCDRVLVLDHGRAAFCGDTSEGISFYRRISGSVEQGFIRSYLPITSAHVSPNSASMTSSDPLNVEVHVNCSEPVTVHPRVVVFDSRSNPVAEGNGEVSGVDPCRLSGGQSVLRVRIAGLPLQAGEYAMTINLHDQNGRLLLHGHRCLALSLSGRGGGELAVQLPISMSADASLSDPMVRRS